MQGEFLDLMLFDVLTGIENLKICYAYELDGEIIHTIPATTFDYARVKPLYIDMPGWTEDITQVSSFEELPQAAQNYIRKIEELTGIKVSLFSVGPDRNQTILLEDLF